MKAMASAICINITKDYQKKQSKPCTKSINQILNCLAMKFQTGCYNFRLY